MRKITPLILLLIVGSFQVSAFFGDTSSISFSSEELKKHINKFDVEVTPLNSDLMEQLPVSAPQVIGGSSILLMYAKNNISNEDLEELGSLISIPDLREIIDMNHPYNSMNDVKAAFNDLGIQTLMIPEFTSLTLKYLKDNGASEALLHSLSSLWIE
ncbi:DUF2780 domain-containing protein [Vibrio jasicida]|uniref:DUF2780 domain-containing protein n=1 Tax=Vibrio jasicida TaxID=766224 RepID=UPI00039C5734|nr:DUF2780 domain-containing protein [Vibrio jasicida]